MMGGSISCRGQSEASIEKAEKEGGRRRRRRRRKESKAKQSGDVDGRETPCNNYAKIVVALLWHTRFFFK